MSVFKILYLLLQLRKLFCHCGICVRQSKRQSQNYFNLLMNIITRHSLLAFRGFVLRGFANSRSCPQNKPKSRTPFSEQDNPQLPNDIYIYIYICVCVCVCACVCVCVCHTAPLTSRCCILYIIQQIYLQNILNMLHTLRFFLFKMPFIS